jgi:beta-lactamase regulating signal transducer with metallopeptidase domain
MIHLALQGAWSILMDFALKSTLLCLVALVCSVFMRRAAAAARHFIWLLLTGSLLTLPVLSVLLPRWNIVVTSRSQMERPAPSPMLSGTIPASPARDASSPARDWGTEADRPVASAFQAGAAHGLASTESALLAPAQTTQPRPQGNNGFNFATALVAGWMLGCALLLMRLGAGLLSALRLRHDGSCMRDEGALALLADVRRCMNVRRSVTLLQTAPDARLQAPVTFGILRAVIAVPAGMLHWPEGRLRPVLLHEMAHIARGDWATEVLARIVRSIYWFNPLVIYSIKRLHAEGEAACDDRVLLAGVGATAYADVLMEILQNMKTPYRNTGAALGMACPPIENRLRAILSGETRRTGLTRSLSIVSSVVMSAVLLPIAAVHVGAAGPLDRKPPVEAPSRHASQTQAVSAKSQEAAHNAQVRAMQRQIDKLQVLLLHERAVNQKLEHAMHITLREKKEAQKQAAIQEVPAASLLKEAFEQNQSKTSPQEALSRAMQALQAKRGSLEENLKRDDELNHKGFMSDAELQKRRLSLDNNQKDIARFKEEMRNQNSDQKVPVLGDVPLIRKLFRSKPQTEQDSPSEQHLGDLKMRLGKVRARFAYQQAAFRQAIARYQAGTMSAADLASMKAELGATNAEIADLESQLTQHQK